jgi:hypothetical protein
MMSDKLNKFLVVIFLTLLIWAWAYMKIQKPLSRSGSLEVSTSIDPGTLVMFSLNDGASYQTEIPLTSLNFKGTPSKVSDLSKRYELPPGHEDKERLDFYYDPGERTESYTLELLDYLQKSSKVQELALTLESCTPTQVDVKIEKLVEKELPVECVDKDGLELKGAYSDPSVVKIYVRKDYLPESAIVVLSPQLIETAREEAVPVTPYVELGIAKVRRESQTSVQVKLRTEDRLKEFPFQPTSIGFLMSPEIAGNYKVELTNEIKLTERTLFNATDKAMDAYKKMPFHILIEIRDGDELQPEIPPRPVIYNFPPEFVRSGEIELADELRKEAKIKIEPLNPEAE